MKKIVEFFIQKKKKNNSRIWFDISMIAKKKKEKR